MERRRFLQLGAASAVVLAVAGGTAALWTPGLRDDRLTTEGRAAMGALARAYLGDALAPTDTALKRHLDLIDELIGALQPAVRDELGLLLSLLTNAGGRLGLFGHATALELRPVDALRSTLEGLRHSRLALRQQAYFGLRELHAGTHYAQPEAWARIGYPGPLKI
jgi:hypothetical protein